LGIGQSKKVIQNFSRPTLIAARQTTHWELRGYKTKPGGLRKYWVYVIKRDLRQMDLTWEAVEGAGE